MVCTDQSQSASIMQRPQQANTSVLSKVWWTDLWNKARLKTSQTSTMRTPTPRPFKASAPLWHWQTPEFLICKNTDKCWWNHGLRLENAHILLLFILRKSRWVAEARFILDFNSGYPILYTLNTFVYKHCCSHTHLCASNQYGGFNTISTRSSVRAETCTGPP